MVKNCTVVISQTEEQTKKTVTITIMLPDGLLQSTINDTSVRIDKLYREYRIYKTISDTVTETIKAHTMQISQSLVVVVI